METLELNYSPAYIPFIIQITGPGGSQTDPSADNLIIYEESGSDSSFDSTQISGSPFDPAKVNSKTGLWGVLVPKSAFTAGKYYLALWEITVDGISTAKVEKFFATSQGVDIVYVKQMMKGRWKIDTATNKLTFYDSNGTTPLIIFDLKDSVGSPTSDNPVERVEAV